MTKNRSPNEDDQTPENKAQGHLRLYRKVLGIPDRIDRIPDLPKIDVASSSLAAEMRSMVESIAKRSEEAKFWMLQLPEPGGNPMLAALDAGEDGVDVIVTREKATTPMRGRLKNIRRSSVRPLVETDRNPLTKLPDSSKRMADKTAWTLSADSGEDFEDDDDRESIIVPEIGLSEPGDGELEKFDLEIPEWPAERTILSVSVFEWPIEPSGPAITAGGHWPLLRSRLSQPMSETQIAPPVLTALSARSTKDEVSEILTAQGHELELRMFNDGTLHIHTQNEGGFLSVALQASTIQGTQSHRLVVTVAEDGTGKLQLPIPAGVTSDRITVTVGPLAVEDLRLLPTNRRRERLKALDEGVLTCDQLNTNRFRLEADMDTFGSVFCSPLAAVALRVTAKKGGA